MTMARFIYACVVVCVVANSSAAGQYAVLHSYNPVTDADPAGVSVVGSQLVIATQGRNSPNLGTIDSMNTDGTGFTVLHSFAGGASDGSYPVSEPTLSGTALYGGTLFGGSKDDGTIYAMNVNGTGFHLLHTFLGGANDGVGVANALTVVGSTIYGATGNGGTNNRGTVFSMNTDGTGFQVLRSFSSGPSLSTVVGSTIYGTTGIGGTSNDGTLFAMNTDGSGFHTLHNFNGTTDGKLVTPDVTLVGSTLFGVADSGGPANQNGGTLFALNLDGSNFRVLHAFGAAGDGMGPQGPVTLIGGMLFGTTTFGGAAGKGAIYSVALDGSNYSLVHSMTGTPGDGAVPIGRLVQAGSTLYGVTQQGGSFSSVGGTVFALVPEPSTLALAAFGFLALAAWHLRRR
jgi:uncharacterized repeat protein (TIGR03803 family)